MRRPLVAANWKMVGSQAFVRALLSELTAILADGSGDVLICPPFPYLSVVGDALAGSRVALGAQNLHAAVEGAFTGEVSGSMLKDLACSFVLVGHSERRTLFHEDDATVAAKFGAAQREGLTPVLCVGESLDQREAGDTLSVVGRQLDAVTASYGVKCLANAVLAYEPVWAIGTGRTATVQQAQEVHEALRKRVPAEIGENLRILYGGSVKAANATALFAQNDIDGVLVGGASLDGRQFAAICKAAG